MKTSPIKALPKLYIANGAMQNMNFCFRCPKTRQLRYKTIPNRKQIVVQDGYDGDEINQIIRDLERFGGREAQDVASLESPFGLLYFVDRPIEADKIDQAIEMNKEIIQGVASIEAENAGIAAFASVSKHADAAVNATELEVVQLDQYGKMPKPGSKGVDFSVGVSKRVSGRQEGVRH